MAQIITGYLILAQLDMCIKDNGCCLDNFAPQTIPNFKPLTLEKAGCTLFTLITGSKQGAFQLQGCNGKYLTIDGQKLKTTNSATELAIVAVKDLQQYFTPSKHQLTEPSNPIYLLDSRNGNPKIGQECIRIFPMSDTVDYSLGCGICEGEMNTFTRHAAWNFVEENSQSISCDAGKCPQSLYNGLDVNVEGDNTADARNALLYAPVSFGLKVRYSAKLKYVITNPLKRSQFQTITCVTELKRFCFETRKVSKVFIDFFDNTGSKIPKQIRVSRPARYRKTCLSSQTLPQKPFFKIEMRFRRFGLASTIFIRHLDIGGCNFL